MAMSQLMQPINEIFEVTQLCRQQPHQVSKSTFSHMINIKDLNNE
jgi:hypothetical protein